VPVHLRIALTYGGLFAMVIVAVVLGSYGVVARTSYQDVDRELQTQGRHVVSTLREASTSPYSLESIATGDLVIHLYDPDSGLLTSSDGDGTVPLVDPREVLERPAGPPFDPIAALSPSLTPDRPEPGAFATVTAAGQRWRVFVRSLDRAQTPYRYVEVVQLLLILVDNAFKYTPPDGTVLLALQRDSDTAQVTVRDTGVGIAADDLPHVFERFFRADPARTRSQDGAGLGWPSPAGSSSSTAVRSRWRASPSAARPPPCASRRSDSHPGGTTRDVASALLNPPCRGRFPTRTRDNSQP
jgi:hypothetical protein